MKTLVLVDIQNDFLKGGSLAVPEGEKIIKPINKIIKEYDLVIATKDWHPKNHISFASNHSDKKIGDIINVNGVDQVLWPDHCIQGSMGASFHPDLNHTRADVIIRKGSNPAVDSYSAFYENDKVTSTGLHGYLKNREVTKLTLVGLATDYCVAFSALDAAKLGYAVTVRLDMARGIDTDGSLNVAIDKMAKAGIHLVNG